MKDWERSNAEEMVEGLVGLSLEGIEETLGQLAGRLLAQLMEHLEKRYRTRSEKSFAEILHGLCMLEASKRLNAGGGDE
jgi:predicted nuclease of restriction endonuclease-like RecB superfamily